MDAVRLKKYTLEEYIQLEQETDTKYEYHDGEVFAMAGGTLNHNIISGNIYSDIDNTIRKKGAACIPFNSDTKLHIERANKYFYPDAMVVCGDLERSSQYSEAITNPVVIVEVLSKSTADYDRGGKFHCYRKIKSLQEYILITQDEAVVDTYRKRGDFWVIDQHVVGLKSMLTVYALDIQLAMEDLYRNVVFVKQ